jgi:hypothetical protein
VIARRIEGRLSVLCLNYQRNAMTQIYLVPGFMGFTAFGEVAYFRRVPQMLVERLRELGPS